jgi:hypothetical protein
MSEQNPNTTRDFIGGIVLVPLLHILFTIALFIVGYLIAILKVPFFNRDYNIFLLFIPIIVLGITQMLYLLPAYLHFSKKGRSEVCKGILVGGLITLMVNGACSGGLVTGIGSAMSVGVVAIAFTIGIAGILWVMKADRG